MPPRARHGIVARVSDGTAALRYLPPWIVGPQTDSSFANGGRITLVIATGVAILSRKLRTRPDAERGFARPSAGKLPTAPAAAPNACLVDDQQPRAPLVAYTCPHPAGDQVDGQRPQLVLEVLDVEHHQPAVQLDVGGTGEQSRAQRALDVALRGGRRGWPATSPASPGGQRAGPPAAGAARPWVATSDGDASLRVRAVDGAIEHRSFVGVERSGGCDGRRSRTA